MTTTPTTGHPEDGVLLRLLDGEASDVERARDGAHAASCDECRARMAAMERRKASLGALLARTDFPVPASAPPETKVIPLRPRAVPDRPWLRAAAILLVVIAAGVVASPARAWIGRWVAERWAELTGDAPERTPPPAAPAPAPAPAPQEAPASQVSFVPSGGELRVVVAHPQAAGALTLAAAEGSSATAEVVGGTGMADLLVLPAALHVRNAPGSAAEYRLALPSTVRRVRVRVGDGRETVVEMAGVDAAGRRVELSARP
jgi:hypothetical protein